jgi:hypothetical protein
MIPADVVDLLEQTGRHCIVGEFGDVQPSPVGSGQCDVKAVVEAAKGVGYKAVYGWAWNGDGGSLNMVSPSWSSNPVAAEYSVTEYIDPILGLLQSPDGPTLQPSVIDSQPSLFPTTSPPSVWPITSHPSLLPTTSEPSLRPNVSPTSAQPTVMPTKQPLACPTEVPSFLPTGAPSVLPTGKSTYLVIGGVNLQPSYYNDGNVTMGWETMKVYPDIQAVRIEIEPDQVEQSKEWIRQASEQGYHMVVTYHKYSALGSDDVWELQAAAAWWQTNYASMSEAGTFDVNLMNEWYAFIQLYIDVWQIRFSLTVIHTTFISRSIVHFLSGVRIASQPRHTPMHTTLP